MWSPATGTVDLLAPAGDPQFVDINDRGEIVATINQAVVGSVPYLFRNGAWININSLRPSGATFLLQRVMAINNHGWMVGSGTASPPFDLQYGWVLAPPTVDVDVNGQDGPLLTLGPGDPLHVTLALDTFAVPAVTPAEAYLSILTPGGLIRITSAGLSLTPGSAHLRPAADVRARDAAEHLRRRDAPTRGLRLDHGRRQRSRTAFSTATISISLLPW